MRKMYVLKGVDYGRDLMATVKGTKNFQYWEFISSETAVRNGIANVPTDEEWQNIEYLAKNALQPLRDRIGKPLDINSGFRCKKLNDLVGSSDASFHRLGCAADIDSDTVDLMDILETASMLPHTEIIAEFFPHGWVHIGLQKNRSDQVVKLKDDNHNYARMSVNKIKEIYA